jgi:hypothetical protein
VTHIALLDVDAEGNAATWGEHVSDEEYRPALRSTTASRCSQDDAGCLPDTHAQHVGELSPAKDQEPVKALAAHGAHPAFDVGVRGRESGSR